MLALPALALAVAAAPLDRAALEAAAARVERDHPGSVTVRATGGGLRQAAGLAARTPGAGEAAARAFLGRYGDAFGVADPAGLETVRVLQAPGRDGVAVFRRRLEGLPVFGGELVVAWRADGAVTLVNGAREPGAARAAGFAIGAAEAREAALRGLAPRPPAEPVAEAGWIDRGGVLRPVWRVVHAAGGWRDHGTVLVDGESGEVLQRIPAAVHLAPCTGARCLTGFLLSPADPPSSLPGGNPPQSFEPQGLSGSGSVLAGLRTTVVNCLGIDVDEAFSSASSCVQTPAGAGGFVSPPDPTGRSFDDPFAEQNAYLHIDAHSRFLDSLDEGFARRTGRGGIGLVPGFVNASDAGGPFENAFFTTSTTSLGGSGTMFFGQGAAIDYAYDAGVVYHELTHAAVSVTADFTPLADRLGVDFDPGSVNEGTADALAVAHFLGSLAGAGLPLDGAATFGRYAFAGAPEFLRHLDAGYTCRGNGPNDGRNPGRIGEVHDDGRIWGSFSWALLREAAACDAEPGRCGLPPPEGFRALMTRALFQALLASTSTTGFAEYAGSVRQKAEDVLGAAGGEFVACTIAQRDLAGCAERSVPLYSGERAELAVRSLGGSGGTALVAPAHQYFVDVPCGAVALHLQALSRSGRSTVWVRYGRPVEFPSAGLGSQALADWRVDGDRLDVRVGTGEGAVTCAGTQTPFGPGRWYLAPAGEESSSIGRNTVTVGVSVEMPAGQAPPARVPYLFGNGAGDPNRCTWGGGPVPSPDQPPAYASPPPLGSCTAPAAPASLPALCTAPPVTRSSTSGCGCGPGGGGGALPALAVLLLLWRRRAALLGPRRA